MIGAAALPRCLPPPLDASTVRVWHIAVDEAGASRLWPLLDPGEQARADRFRHTADRIRFVVARGLLRTLLGQYTECDPSVLRLEYGDRGKPFLAHLRSAALHFNVAHAGTQALVALATTPVGVDIERIPDEAPEDEIVRTVLTPGEQAWLASLPPPERAAAFARCWTLKEACVKATGRGFEIAPDRLSVCPAARGEQMAIAPTPGSAWRLHLLEAAAGYQAAAAVSTGVTALASHRWAG